MKQYYEKRGKKPRVFKLPKRDDQPINIPFTKSQFLAMDNIFWWYKIQNNLPKPLEVRVSGMIDHLRNYLV